MNAEEALAKLKEGNQKYVANALAYPHQDGARKQEVSTGQSPFAIILSCADSRVVPELIFDQGLGDIFVARVAGNVANASSTASIEYAVAHLGTRLIVVLGHESCGAVTAATLGGDNGPNLNHLLKHIKPAVDAMPGAQVNDIVKKNAELTAAELLNTSEILRGVDDLQIVPAYYSLSSGEVEFL